MCITSHCEISIKNYLFAIYVLWSRPEKASLSSLKKVAIASTLSLSYCEKVVFRFSRNDEWILASVRHDSITNPHFWRHDLMARRRCKRGEFFSLIIIIEDNSWRTRRMCIGCIQREIGLRQSRCFVLVVSRSGLLRFSGPFQQTSRHFKDSIGYWLSQRLCQGCLHKLVNPYHEFTNFTWSMLQQSVRNEMKSVGKWEIGKVFPVLYKMWSLPQEHEGMWSRALTYFSSVIEHVGLIQTRFLTAATVSCVPRKTVQLFRHSILIMFY